MLKNKIDLKIFGTLLLLAFVIYFAQTRDFGLLFDGLTYSTLAKNMLRTGDYKTLHYGLRQYTDAYYHPPLAMWIQSFIYKLFGTAEPVSRIFPATCALLTTAGLFLFARARFGITAAFWASIALISSTRFIKWGTNFYLDGISGFFNFTSFILFVWLVTQTVLKKKICKKNIFLSLLAGIFLSLGFMTKGVVALPILVAVALACILFFSKESFIYFLLFLTGSALPLLWWIQFFDGGHYLQHYFSTSAFGRAQELNFSPWKNLYHVWWPWFPIFIFGLLTALQNFLGLKTKRDMIVPVIAAASLAMPAALTLSYFYYEHYLTPFFPFAAILVGIQMSKWIKKDFSPQYLKTTFALTVTIAVFLATVAPNVNHQKDIPATLWIRELNTLPEPLRKEIKIVVFTEASADLWINLATLLGRTDWQSAGVFSLNEPALPNSILVTKTGEIPHASWRKIPYLFVEGNEFYSSFDL